ncbi:MAG TPA: hypothetical protein VNA04_09240 [Thermoanaerobaculia bacterium]|nr:hypothetical protein [Thermoanaerobaculia bacterium]
MKRLGFLPLFFLILGVAFAVAVFLRVRSYQVADEIALRPGRPPSAAAERGAGREESPVPPPAARAVAPDHDPVPLLDRPPRFVVAQPSASAATAIPAPQPRTAQATPPRTATVAAATPPERPRGEAPPRTSARQVSEPSGERPSSREQSPPEPDPTSDSTPPRLIAMEFVPPQVADGEETLLVIQAADDLSGIRTVSGTILAPSGAVQGFAAQRDGDAGRYVARVMVPKDAAEGLWSVNYLNLTDNASNTAAITAARGELPPGASFRVVSSRPDSEGPTLHAIWLDRRSMRGGEKNLIFVRAHDDKTGVNLVSGIFQSPSRAARVGFVCRAGGDALWTCELTAPTCADCGEWQLEQLQLQDKANNMTTLRASSSEMLAAVRVDILSDFCDATPPQMQSIVLDRRAVSNAGQSAIEVTVRLTDDACGVLSVSAQATGPQSSGIPPRLYFSFTRGGDPHLWVGRLVVPRLAAKGVWRISFLQVLDRGQNLKTYTQNDPLLASATFVVE